MAIGLSQKMTWGWVSPFCRAKSDFWGMQLEILETIEATKTGKNSEEKFVPRNTQGLSIWTIDSTPGGNPRCH